MQDKSSTAIDRPVYWFYNFDYARTLVSGGTK
jgi:hypothetical protein